MQWNRILSRWKTLRLCMYASLLDAHRVRFDTIHAVAQTLEYLGVSWFQPDTTCDDVREEFLFNVPKPKSPKTIPFNSYAYDVDPVTQMFKNRRVFAYTDNGVPDGIELDSNGNVYSGCGDGIQVCRL